MDQRVAIYVIIVFGHPHVSKVNVVNWKINKTNHYVNRSIFQYKSVYPSLVCQRYKQQTWSQNQTVCAIARICFSLASRPPILDNKGEMDGEIKRKRSGCAAVFPTIFNNHMTSEFCSLQALHVSKTSLTHDSLHWTTNDGGKGEGYRLNAENKIKICVTKSCIRCRPA